MKITYHYFYRVKATEDTTFAYYTGIISTDCQIDSDEKLRAVLKTIQTMWANPYINDIICLNQTGSSCYPTDAPVSE